jgi:hypothetical protein
MNFTPEQTKTVTTPDQAIDQFVGEQFIEWLASFILHEIRTSPGLLELSHKATKPEKLRKFLLQRFLAGEAFWGAKEGDPGFLGFIIANLSESDDPQAETVLEYLTDRKQQGSLKDHAGTGGNPGYSELWQRLLLHTGLSEEEIKKTTAKPPTRDFIAELSDIYSSSDWHLAIGALAAQELSETEENRVIFDLIRVSTEVPERELDTLLSQTSSYSQAVIFANKILDKIVYDKEAKSLIVQGANRQLQIRKDFLKGLAKYL